MAGEHIRSLASRASLPSGFDPFSIGEFEQRFYVKESGNGTQTVLTAALQGFEKSVEDLRVFVNMFQDRATASLIVERFPSIGWMGEAWIGEHFCESCHSSPREIATEMVEALAKELPQLRRWWNPVKVGRGTISSVAKAAAARVNGKKGGRPR